MSRLSRIHYLIDLPPDIVLKRDTDLQIFTCKYGWRNQGIKTMKIPKVVQYIAVVCALLLLSLILPSLFPLFAQDRDNPIVPVVTDFPPPKALSLCNEPMPLNDRWVWEMLDRELTISVWDRAQVFMWLKRAGRYFPYLEKKLTEEGLPQDLKYLAIAESSLLLHIKSHKGATGPWQFMPQTAVRHGLRKDRRVDERRNFEQATEAALRYLKGLKGAFGTWTLALASYNCGEARLKEEMKEQKETDYYRLNLPEETERFIYRIAAIKLIMEAPEQYGFRLPKERIYKPIPCDTVDVKVRVPIHLADLSTALGTNLKAIKDLNPQIMGYHLPSGNYTLKTPPGTGSKVSSALKTLSRTATPTSQPVSGKYYTVESGDTLTQVSKKTGVSLSTLRKLNNLEDSLIKVGQRLRLTP